MRQSVLMLLSLVSLVLGVPTMGPCSQEKEVQYMIIISPQENWLQRGAEKFLPTQMCFLATDDNDALLKAHVKIQQKLLPQLPPHIEKQLKFKLLRAIPSEHCPFERPAS